MSPAPSVVIGEGAGLGVDDVVAVADGAGVELGEEARGRMERAHAESERIRARGDAIYGLSTGVGSRIGVRVEQASELEFNRVLVLSHCVGHGPLAPPRWVRAAMVVRAQGLALGGAGVRPAVVEAICAALADGIEPSVHLIGSVGQSDLAPLAEVARALMERGLRLEGREGLALMSANAFSVGIGCLALVRAERALEAFDRAAALTYEGVLGNVAALDPAVAAARPYPGLRESLERLRALLEGGALLRGEREPVRLQDFLSLRVVPQTHGAAREALRHARGQLGVELGSAGDNPLLAEDRIVSNGNFDSTPVGIALDYARLGLAQAVSAAGDRVTKLLTAPFSGLPGGLRERDDSAEEGLMIFGQDAAAIAAEARLLAAPVTLEHPTSGIEEAIEDRITMTPLAARRLDELAELALRLAAVELLCAAQAVDLRGRAGELGVGTARDHALVREHAPFTRAGEPPVQDLDGLVARL